jgi:hypothetical protein
MNTGERLKALRMTSNDTKFMMEIGIEPCDLCRPFQRSLPLLPFESLIHCLIENDIFWLLKVGVKWWADPAPDFVLPKNLQEYLDHYPRRIRKVVEVIAKELKLKLSDDKLDDLAQQIIVMFLECAENEEDLVETYSLSNPPQPGEDRSAHFRTYFNRCIRAGMLALWKNDPHPR